MSRSIRPLAERLLQLPYEELSRGELLARYARLGDVRAFEVLLRRGMPLVVARCRESLHVPAEAEEVASEVFALLAVKAGGIRDPEQIDTWLARTAENLCRNHNRKAARRRSLEQPLPPPGTERPELTAGPLPDVQAELREQHRLVLDEIERLSETLRRTLEVVQQTGSYTEAAATLGCTLAKVKQDVSRARRKLLARLSARGITVPATLAAVLFGPKHADAWGGSLATASWLVRRWYFWIGFIAVGFGSILLFWPKEDREKELGEPVVAEARESLQDKNLRIFHEEVKPKIIASLEKLAGKDVHLAEVRAEGTEVIGMLEGARPLVGSHPPRVRFRYCVLSRHVASELDLLGTGQWKASDPDRIVLRPELFGKPLAEWKISIEDLDLRSAFEQMPTDERAMDEFNAWLQDRPVSTDPDLVFPGGGWEGVAGNSRYLYAGVVNGLLLACDREKGFPGWRCIGPCDRQRADLAANDSFLFRAREGGQIEMRPAEPVVHEWRSIGPMLPDGGALAASRDALYSAKPDFTLWSRPIDSQNRKWRRIGPTPGGRELVVCGDRLYCLSPRDGEPVLWSRPIEGDAGKWERAGDDPRLGMKGGVRMTMWGDQLLIWAMFDERVFARPAQPGPEPWRQIGKKDLWFLRRW